jgi:hypothetical protein
MFCKANNSFSAITVAVGVLCFSLLVACPQEKPNLAKLAQLGARNLEKANQAPASWTLTGHASSGGMVTVKTTKNRNGQSWLFFATVKDQTTKLCEIYETEGFWYVIEGSRKIKTRPFEAVLQTPGVYYFLSLATPRFVTGEVLLQNAKFEQQRGDVASYRIPPSPEVRAAMETVLTNIQEASLKNPDLLKRPDAIELVRLAHERLEEGTPLSINIRTGMIVEEQTGFGQKELTLSIKDFRWLDGPETNRFDLPEVDLWEDRSESLSVEDLKECVLVLHDPLFRDRNNRSEPDGCVLNLKTGKLRRLPYRGFASIPCCFMNDRRYVIVVANDVNKGSMRLVKLDLLTGENWDIIRDGDAAWTPLTAKISPDDRWLISQSYQKGNTPWDFQMHLIDLANGKLRQLGKTGEFGGALSWLPGGDAVIVRRFQSANEPTVISRLGINGTQKDVRVGDMPLVLRKSKRILYRDQESALWYTCNLDGSDPNLYADGMKGCGNPTVSPEEERIIFDRGGGGKVTKPMLFEFGKTNGTPITTAEGFTGHSVW